LLLGEVGIEAGSVVAAHRATLPMMLLVDT
jgi:hypothetical protein